MFFRLGNRKITESMSDILVGSVSSIARGRILSILCSELFIFCLSWSGVLQTQVNKKISAAKESHSKDQLDGPKIPSLDNTDFQMLKEGEKYISHMLPL